MIRRSIIILLAALLAYSSVACGPQSGNPTNASPDNSQDVPIEESRESDNGKASESSAPVQEEELEKTLEEKMENKIQATITMENGGVMIVELYPDVAPQSVRNFVHLAREGFYDGLKFHRIIKGFMIQGGCPLGNGTGNPGYSIKGEFSSNGFDNDLLHSRGVLSMARSNAPDSAGSQFFIMHADSPHLDGSYAAFGYVIEGMDVIDLIAQTPVTDNNGSVAPANMPIIQSITIDDDIELPEPDKLVRN